MDLSIDHVVIVVNDLSLASENYAALGFTVVPGGEHADGLTHNALIAFSDGTYIEIIAFKSAPPESHLFGRALQWGGGFVAYALLPHDVARTIAEARERGLRIDGPTPGGRVRPDGEQISWQTGRPTTFDLPFLCADVTPRDRRVPGGAARQHANSISGIQGITIVVSNLVDSAAHYRALLGIEPMLGASEQTTSFQVNGFIITLIKPTEGPMREYLNERGDVPYLLTLRAAQAASAGYLDPALTGGAWLQVAHAATLSNEEYL